ncbi:MAG: hypothetical protein K0Q72_2276 [Armatimonadetes bacterium]|nr:hypothetical protein [Armatimonadota bacterium]
MPISTRLRTCCFRLAAHAVLAGLLLAPVAVRADVGDPQLRTDHPWYPGELSCSTFERLFATQAELYRRVVGVVPKTDEEKALAAWLWRSTHYWHGEEGARDLWGKGFTAGTDLRNREYWSGLFADGFGLCGTTHSQWVPEMQALFGVGRGRGVGVAGHNSFEVFLKGGAYGSGKWVLLDHDLSTVIYSPDGGALLSIPEVMANWKQLTDRAFKPEKQHGWPVVGLDPGDGAVYADYNTAEYLAGYSGPPPVVHLRRGETLRRYLEPGLGDGKTFVFWGRNYGTGGIPGPERSRTWVNQPEKLLGSKNGAGYREGQARYANAVYTYRPDFGGDYREGVTSESGSEVVFEFNTPYVIAATPPNAEPWGIYQPGCRNGLVLRGRASCPVAVSTDGGKSWSASRPFAEGLDLTDLVKGRRQYLLRLGAGAPALRASGLSITTVCQVNSSVLPRLKDGGTRIEFQASGRAVTSAGPELPHAQARVVDGAFGTRSVTLELAAPRREAVLAIHAAAHVLSSNPPDPKVKYRIDYSRDGGQSWQPIVQDWTITRQGDEPKDFWSQSLCWGSLELPERAPGPVRVRFTNDGGKAYARAEAHLVYAAPSQDPTRVTFTWTDDQGPHTASHTVSAGKGPATWDLPTGRGVRTRWVEFAPEVVK